MQRYTRLLGVFLFYIILVFPIAVCAEKNIIDTTHASDGYFSVCSDADSSKMKIGVTYDKETTYYDYVSGETTSYAFVQGDGTYTINLYQHTGTGKKYKNIASKTVDVKLDNDLAPYLASTNEVTFSQDDIVCKTAQKICNNVEDTGSKITAIYDFVSSNISYDYNLAADIKDGKLDTYVPCPADTLYNKKGICYDFAVLFAAMCRSQDIPCSVEKGNYSGKYHAWDKVYINGEWHDIDVSNPNKHLINLKIKIIKWR